MATTLTQPESLPGGPLVRPRGILAVASPAPESWERGGISTLGACADPLVVGNCVTITPEVAPNPTRADFAPFMIRAGSGCSTLSGDAREAEAIESVKDSTDFALGLTLYSGDANGAKADDLALSEATSVGDPLVGPVAAVAALECAAATEGNGVEYYLHASPGAAAYLRAAGMIDDAGLSPSGAKWIVSAGYPCSATEFRIWATGRVWAAVGQIDTVQGVDRRTNNREAWASRAAIVGFNPCVLLTAAFTAPIAGGAPTTPDAYLDTYF